jgi:peptide/nickel transport system permease protein
LFGFIVRRTITAAFVVLLTSMFLFVLFFYGPINPALHFCQQNGHCTPQKERILERQLQLDLPVTEAYWIWLKGVFVGRTIHMGATYKCPAPCLGISYVDQQNVTGQLEKRYPATLSLAVVGSILYLALGVLFGTIAARRRGTIIDRSLVSFSLFVSSIPYYLVCLMAWLYLYLISGIFPDSRYVSPFQSPLGWAGGLLLPWLVIGLTNSTSYARFSRGYMIESLGEDFVRTARAKGVSSQAAVLKHALRVAIVPVITIFGLDFATLLGGTIFTEYIFGINGMGLYALQAIAPGDFPVIAATVLVAAVFIVIGNLVVDVLYSFLDPRVRLA